MAFSASSSSLSATPNITPLIDVLLVLLIIFMVIVPTTSVGLHSMLPVPSNTAAAKAPVPLVVEVLPAEAGQVGVLYRVDGRVMVLQGFRRALRERQARSAESQVFVSGDHRLDYQPIAQAIGEAHQAGFQAVGLLSQSVH